MKNKKAVAETLQSWLIPLVLVIAFVIIAVSIALSSSQSVSESFSAKVLSKVNLESIPIPELIKSKFAPEKRLEAVIVMRPEQPLCPLETVNFSCTSSFLPRGVSLSNVNCLWDFDTSVDSDGDGIRDNDKDSEGLSVLAVETFNSIRGVEIKLRVIITGDVEGSGKYADALMTVKNTIGCASSEPLPREIGFIPDEGIINLKIPSYVNDVEDVHIFVDSGSEEVSRLNVVVAEDVSAAYSIMDKFTGKHVIFDQSLASRVNVQLSACTSTDYCIVPVRVYTDKPLKIVDVRIPYNNPKPEF